jgi:hypothetical protein
MPSLSKRKRFCVYGRYLVCRHRPVVFDLPKIEGVSDALNASSAVLTACAAGTLSPGEAVEVMGLISSHVRVLEMTEIEAMLTALEKARQP